MVDLNSGTASEQPADDIRSALASALLESEKEPEVTEQPEPKSERARTPDGKFAKAEEKEEPVEEPATEEVKAEEEAPEEPKEEPKGLEPPTHWDAQAKETFKSLPEQGQKFLLDRVKSMEADYTKKTQAIAALKNEFEPIAKMFEPHAQVMRAKGFTPRTIIEAWANVEQQLVQGPDSAVKVVQGLVNGYNIPVDKLAAALGIANRSPAAPEQQPVAVENGQQVALPPEIERELKALREQVGQVSTWKQTQEQREQELARAQQLMAEQQAEEHANQFKSATDEKGNLLHPYAEDVQDMMLLIAQGYVARKQTVPDLKALYDMAVNAHPPTREKVLTAMRQQEEKKRAEEARAKAAKAKAAGSSVTGAPGVGQAPKAQREDLSLREALEAAAEDAA